MYKIVICIPTYKRPDMLEKLILSIDASVFDRSLIGDLSMLVVDNDAEKSAEPTIAALNSRLQRVATIEYHNYPISGLANVRNELIRKSLISQPDLLAFVDDDEYVSPEWLNELVKTLRTTNGDLIMGPVIPVFTGTVSRYISCWLERPVYADNHRLDYLRTGNLLIRAKSLTERDIWFDQRFNSSGGEDSFFGLQMIKNGAGIYWSSNATVFETTPEKRTRLRWLIRRVYNGGRTYTQILQIERDYKGLAKKCLVNIIYFVSGSLASVLTFFPITRRYWGLLRIAESLGGFAGLLNIPSHPYAKKN
jgi:succinoglycan biosynthesis protein ExoM